MPLHNARVAALLAWVNSTKVCTHPLDDLSQLQDCSVFIRIMNKIHRSKEGESVLEQPLPEKISFIRGFLEKHCKHKSATENLVLAQKLLEGEELALAKVTVLLLYYTSMSCKTPEDWNEFDFETQVELASILRFVLDNEESLDENLEIFLQRKALLSASSSSSEEHSPLFSFPHKREVRFLELRKIASSDANITLPSTPSSPMGDIMQTPQFQLRRLKKQLAFERENRDELEVELAENLKLVSEKEAQITMMQQRIDRLTLFNERQAADQQEPKEMEELREKNESLMVRLHDTLKQCQDLKTEKGQLDRKINQLSEENGDLSFKLRGIASHMVQLQEALNELSEEHNAALAQSQEKQGQLEGELRAALQEKKYAEEKIEILQGKISLLEDQLAKLGECSTQEKGEVMGDILKLEELKQEVSSLATKGAELQATVLQLEEEKQQLSGLVASLQSSLSESHQARERLEQDLRAWEASEPQGTLLQGREAEARCEGEAGQLAALDAQHKKTLQERDSALQQLQHLREANVSLSSQLQAMVQAQDASQAASAEEKAELSRKVSELEARILELSAQRQQGAAEELKAQLRELEGRLKESQQRLAEREKLALENTRLQEQLLFLEESLRNTEGILEDEKRQAAESLEGSLAKIAELEAERQQLVQGRELEKEDEEQNLRAEVSSLREKMAVVEQAAAQRAAVLEADARRTAEALEGVSQQLSQEKLKSKELEAAVEQLQSAEAELTRAAAASGEREVKKLSGELTLLSARLEESLREHRRELACREEEAERLRQEVEQAKAECAAERACKAELEQKCREQQEAMAALERATAEAAIAEQAEVEALREAAQQKALELQKLLEASRSAQALHNSTVEALQKELQEKGRELTKSRTAVTAAEKELASLRSAAQEKGRSEESWREQVSQYVEEVERKKSLIGSLEHEVSILHRQVTEKEGESKELKRLIVAESEKSKKLEERLRMLQTEMATAASRAAERCSLMKVEVQRCQEEMEKQQLTIEALKRDRHCQSEREDELRQEVKACQDKCLQKEQLLAALQQELSSAQALAAELPALKHLCQQLQAECASLESQHRQDLEQRAKTLAALQAELARAKLEATEVPSLREQSAEQDRAIQRLQAEAAEQMARLAGLQQANARLAEENRELGESQSRGQQQLEAELGQARERHARELERLQLTLEELVASSRQEAKEAVRKLEVTSNEYESSKAVALEEKKKLLEERQRLTAQVEELNEKLSQHEKATQTQQQRVKVLEGELQAEATRQQEKVAELQAQLAQQTEKAKTYYDAKKQLCQDLAEKLKAMEQLQKENAELRTESERLAKESELSCRNLTSQVRSLEAQVEFANRQLQELGKFQRATDTLKGRETSRQNPGDLSADSLDLSLDEAQPLNSTRKAGRSQLEASVPPGNEESLASQQLSKAESLESFYFTPIPSCRQSQMETSAGSLGDLSLDSGCKTRSAWHRTTNVTVTKAKTEKPDSAVSSCSISAAQPPEAAPGTSTGSLTTFPSQEFFVKLETSSPQETPRNVALQGLPGYRPVTRSSLRHLQRGSSSSLGRSSIYLGTCQDEPEQLDDWNRIAELQQRNQACPPHLKSCYPLEMPSSSVGTITDEQLKMGDPQETLRRASMQSSRVATRRSTLAAARVSGVTDQQRRKRHVDESSQDPDTPKSKKSTSCFPRPQNPRDPSEQCSSQVSQSSEQPGPSMQAQKRQSMVFSILNTPKKLGTSLLRRAARRQTTPKSSGSSTRRSPRIAAAKPPKGKASRQSKDKKT